MKGGISITVDDYQVLEEESFLNDVILDFFLKWEPWSWLGREGGRKGRHALRDLSLPVFAASTDHLHRPVWTKDTDVESVRWRAGGCRGVGWWGVGCTYSWDSVYRERYLLPDPSVWNQIYLSRGKINLLLKIWKICSTRFVRLIVIALKFTFHGATGTEAFLDCKPSILTVVCGITIYL